jgi:PPM family protein phosphatase
VRRMTAVGATDVGRSRQKNEDAILVLDSIYAVADGVGGQAAGEVASRTALGPLRELDGRIFPDDGSASTALSEAVMDANDLVRELADKEPTYRGMGTTVTAALLEGRRLHVAHVGDSRAYLLRDGALRQITEDHTLVQHLIDEGHISKEEASKHPQRNIVTRAIGVAEDVEVDALTLDLLPGDQVLLCSDGLTGVIGDDTIADRLAQDRDPDATIAELIDAANEAGGPDNISVLLLRYDDSEAEVPAEPMLEPVTRTIAISTRQESEDGDWAGRLGTYGALSRGGPAPQSEDEERRPGQILGRATAIVLALGLIIALVVVGGQFLLSRSYFVGLEGDEVVIYQGIDMDLGPVPLARVAERTELTLDEIPAWFHPQLEAGRPAAHLNDARRIVRGIPVREDEEDGTAEDAEDGGTEGGAAPATSETTETSNGSM